MRYTLIDHGLTPYSSHEEIMRWWRELKESLAADPDNDGLASALNDVERIARIAGLEIGHDPDRDR